MFGRRGTRGRALLVINGGARFRVPGRGLPALRAAAPGAAAVAGAGGPARLVDAALVSCWLASGRSESRDRLAARAAGEVGFSACCR